MKKLFYSYLIALYNDSCPPDCEAEFTMFKSLHSDEEDAVIDCIEDHHSDFDYYEGEHTVYVKRENDEIAKYVITAEPAIHFSATKINVNKWEQYKK